MQSLEIKNPILAAGAALGITAGSIGIGVGIEHCSNGGELAEHNPHSDNNPPSEAVYDLQESTAIIMEAYHSNVEFEKCDAIREEATKRVAMILDAHFCQLTPIKGRIYYEVKKKNPEWEKPADFWDLSSVQGTTGDCRHTLYSWGTVIDAAKPVCDIDGNVINQGRSTGGYMGAAIR
ncbi:hypothetical protein HY463_00100 [Candidatus Peregrinibacteria bacterium]|nr:hypothetical protein [Candidatus Peregrinibacteria bacterium]